MSQVKQAKDSLDEKIEPAKLELSIVQWLFGATALLSAILFYISWVYQHRYFESFGLYPEMINFTGSDYFLNAKSALSVNVLIIVLLVSVRLYINLESKIIRWMISLLSGIGIMGSLVYIINDIRVWWSAFGINMVGYRSVWLLSVIIFVLLTYSMLAPVIIYNRVRRSKPYAKFSYLVVWSSLGVLAFLLITLTTNAIGYLEGRHDVSITSRLAFISITTRTPLGFNLSPDAITKDAQDNDLFTYSNLRILTKHDDILYVFRPEDNTRKTPLMHLVPMSNVYSSSMGRYEPVPTTTTVVTPTPQ